MMPAKQTPSGFVATCQCGVVVGALDYQRTEHREAGKLLGQWLAGGCTVAPRFTGAWKVHIGTCKCKTTPQTKKV